jgi:hypothetical protein
MSSILAQDKSAEEQLVDAADSRLSPLEAEAIGIFVQLGRLLSHPCKIYNIMAVGAPVLYISPRLSHIAEILSAADGEAHCLSSDHGEVEVVVKQILRVRDEARQSSRQRSLLIHSLFANESVLPQMITELESV